MDDTRRLRFLETWLPLAQQLNTVDEWRCDARELEALVLNVWSGLQAACSADDARAILRAAHLSEGKHGTHDRRNQA